MTWQMARCVVCYPQQEEVMGNMPFQTEQERTDWAVLHVRSNPDHLVTTWEE